MRPGEGPERDSFHLQSSQIYDPHPLPNLRFPSHLISITSSFPSCPDFRHGCRAPAVRLWPSDLDGGAVLRQQALPGVDAELPEVIGERRQPPLVHLLGSVQFRGGSGERQQHQRRLHHTSDPGSSIRSSYSGAQQQLDTPTLLTWMGSQHADGQRGLQVRLEQTIMSITTAKRDTGLVFSAALTSVVGLVGVFQPSSAFHQRIQMLCLLERERCGKQWRREVCSAFWERRAAVYELNPETFF